MEPDLDRDDDNGSDAETIEDQAVLDDGDGCCVGGGSGSAKSIKVLSPSGASLVMHGEEGGAHAKVLPLLRLLQDCGLCIDGLFLHQLKCVLSTIEAVNACPPHQELAFGIFHEMGCGKTVSAVATLAAIIGLVNASRSLPTCDAATVSASTVATVKGVGIDDGGGGGGGGGGRVELNPAIFTRLVHIVQQPTLVVVPASVLTFWQSTFRGLLPRLATADKIAVAHGPRAAEVLAEAAVVGGMLSVVFTTYGMVLRHTAAFRAVAWGCVILDEAHVIRNSGSKTAGAVRGVLHAEHNKHALRLVLTGTPVNNTRKDLKTLRDITGVYRYDRVLKHAVLRLPPVRAERRHYEMTVAQSIAYTVLWGAVVDTHTWWARLRGMYPANHPEVRHALERYMCATDQLQMSTLHLGLLKHLNDITSRIGGDGTASAEADVKALCAQIDDEAQPEFASPVIRACAEQIEAHFAATDRGIIIISQWTSLLDIVLPHCRKLRIPTDKGCDVGVVGGVGCIDGTGGTRELRIATLDGSVPPSKRGQIISAFQRGEVDVVLLSMHTSLGITLTRATRVVFLSMWNNPHVHAQAQDRAHRIGQDVEVCAVTLMAVRQVTLGKSKSSSGYTCLTETVHAGIGRLHDVRLGDADGALKEMNGALLQSCGGGGVDDDDGTNASLFRFMTLAHETHAFKLSEFDDGIYSTNQARAAVVRRGGGGSGKNEGKNKSKNKGKGKGKGYTGRDDEVIVLDPEPESDTEPESSSHDIVQRSIVGQKRPLNRPVVPHSKERRTDEKASSCNMGGGGGGGGGGGEVKVVRRLGTSLMTSNKQTNRQTVERKHVKQTQQRSAPPTGISVGGGDKCVAVVLDVPMAPKQMTLEEFMEFIPPPPPPVSMIERFSS